MANSNSDTLDCETGNEYKSNPYYGNDYAD